MASFNRSTQISLWSAVGLAVVAGALAIPSMLTAQPAPAPAAAGAADRPQPFMQAMGSAYGMIRGGVSDAAKNEASLKALADFEAAVIGAKNTVPPTVAALPEADRPARLVEYKKELVKLMRATLEVEDALLAGDNAKAATAFAALGPIQQEGHRGFRGRGGGGGGGRPGGPPPGGAPGGGGPAGAGRAPQ